jgi:hypothetical protein
MIEACYAILVGYGVLRNDRQMTPGEIHGIPAPVLSSLVRPMGSDRACSTPVRGRVLNCQGLRLGVKRSEQARRTPTT